MKGKNLKIEAVALLVAGLFITTSVAAMVQIQDEPQEILTNKAVKTNEIRKIVSTTLCSQYFDNRIQPSIIVAIPNKAMIIFITRAFRVACTPRWLAAYFTI